MTSTTLIPPTPSSRRSLIVKIRDEDIPRANGRRGRRLSWRSLRVGPVDSETVRLRA